MLETRRFGCWFVDDPNYNFLKSSHKSGDLAQIFNKRRPDGSVCLLDRILHNYGLIQSPQFNMMNSFYLMNKLAVYFVLSIFSRILKKIIFENSFFDYELLQVHLIRKSLQEDLKAKLLVK